MIPNITKGQDFRPLMRYLVGPGRANEHVMPHLVGGDSAIMTWFGTDELSGRDAAKLARELAVPSRVRGAAPKSGPVWHCSLSIKATDRALTDDEWSRLAGSFLDKMQWSAQASGRSPMPWVAVHHGRSTAGNDHIHLVVSLVREDGTFVNTHNDYKRAQTACRELEKEFGLAEVRGPALDIAERGATAAEQRISARTGREPSRVTLERAVRAAATTATSEAAFIRAVRAMDLRIAPYFAAGRNDVVTGYKVGLKGPDERMFGGGHLSRDLTLPRLRLRWADTPEAAMEAAAEWRKVSRDPGARATRPDRPSFDEIRADRINRQMWELRERLRTVDPNDQHTWAEMAHETAGILSAWSRAREGDQPGPLADAALAVRRLAQTRVYVSTRRAPRPSTTGAALLAMTFAHGGRGKVAEAIFLRQMLNTLKAIHDAAVARREACTAARIQENVRAELVALVRKLPVIPEPMLAGEPPTIAAAAAAAAGPPAPLGPPIPNRITTADRRTQAPQTPYIER